MLELKFAIYCRAASLPSQASYAALAEKSQEEEEEEEEEDDDDDFGRLVTFWFGTFAMLFSLAASPSPPGRSRVNARRAEGGEGLANFAVD